jgi:hypothetical protein
MPAAAFWTLFGAVRVNMGSLREGFTPLTPQERAKTPGSVYLNTTLSPYVGGSPISAVERMNQFSAKIAFCATSESVLIYVASSSSIAFWKFSRLGFIKVSHNWLLPLKRE